MKRFYFGFFLLGFFALRSFGNDSTLLHLEPTSMACGCLAIDEGWKFQRGDAPEWAARQLNDSSWKLVNLKDYVSYFPAGQREFTGWFRKTLYVDSALALRPLAVSLWQLGASEVYLNGKLFLHLGNILDQSKVSSDNPHYKPFIFQLNPGDTVTMAIRYSTRLPARLGLFQSSGARPFKLKMGEANATIDHYETSLLDQRVPVGFSFIAIGFGVLFFLLYSFFRDRRVYLLFAAYCFLLGTIAGLRHQLTEGNLTVASYAAYFFLQATVEKLAIALIFCILALTICTRVRLLEWATLFYFVVFCSLVEYFVSPASTSVIVSLLGRVFMTAALGRLCWVAIRNQLYFPAAIALVSALFNFSHFYQHFFHLRFFDAKDHEHLVICFVLLSMQLVGTLRSSQARIR